MARRSHRIFPWKKPSFQRISRRAGPDLDSVKKTCGRLRSVITAWFRVSTRTSVEEPSLKAQLKLCLRAPEVGKRVFFGVTPRSRRRADFLKAAEGI